MAKIEANKSEQLMPTNVDLGDATEKTLGNQSAGVRETLGPKRYRSF